jgi:hypothetical protein
MPQSEKPKFSQIIQDIDAAINSGEVKLPAQRRFTFDGLVMQATQTGSPAAFFDGLGAVIGMEQEMLAHMVAGILYDPTRKGIYEEMKPGGAASYGSASDTPKSKLVPYSQEDSPLGSARLKFYMQAGQISGEAGMKLMDHEIQGTAYEFAHVHYPDHCSPSLEIIGRG